MRLVGGIWGKPRSTSDRHGHDAVSEPTARPLQPLLLLLSLMRSRLPKNNKTATTRRKKSTGTYIGTLMGVVSPLPLGELPAPVLGVPELAVWPAARFVSKSFFDMEKKLQGREICL